MTTAAIIAPRITGSISAASSALIIFIIFQSRSKLSTIYHRIMFGMSCVDIVGSVAMALTTLPMPKHLPPKPNVDSGYNYPYAGTRLGNAHTCSAQGFIFGFGAYTMFTYNLTLCIYNTCYIVFRVQERTMKRYIEPFIHLFPLAVGLGIALPPLIMNLYIPTADYMWCVPYKPVANYLGITRLYSFYYTLFSVLTIIYIVVIAICGSAMIRKVFNIERQISRTHSSANHERVVRCLKNTKVLIFQVSAYILSYLLTLSLTLLGNFIPSLKDHEIVVSISQALLPLQGFFNALIFIYSKIYNYRRVNDDVSRCHVFKLLLLAGKSTEVILFSRISMINHDQQRMEMEVELGDENGSFERFTLEEYESPSAPDVFSDDEQNLSGFSSSPSKTFRALDGADSILPSTSPSRKNEDSSDGGHSSPERNEDSLNGDSRLSMSKKSEGILSWMSRGVSSGISFTVANEDEGTIAD